MPDTVHYQVIIVGGRPAGATLAARLGQAGLRVLLLERATLPSLPAVSSPAIYGSSMRLLDEIGAEEADYAQGTPRLRRWVYEFRDDFRVVNQVPEVLGRDYGYAIDRARFDDALWRLAARSPSVTARQAFGVTDLLWDGERVAGVVGKTRGGDEEHFTGDVVVGADGRFSLVAAKVKAASHDVRADLPTSLYYAYWRGVEAYDGSGPCVHIFGPGYGLGFLLMDSADGTCAVVTEGQSALLDPDQHGGAEAMYLGLLQQYPQLWRRFKHAERVTTVRGIKKVGNLYRQAGGPGWALVGDAYHQVDPIDGQGVFDALFTARALAKAVLAYTRGQQTWPQALAAYDAEVRAETFPMYRETLNRVQRELYTRHPEWAFKTWVRWLTQDPAYKRRLALLITRGIPAEGWLPASVFLGALARGAWGDVKRLGRREEPALAS